MDGGAPRYWVSALISTWAIALAAVHVLRPTVSIDAVTLLLLAVAAVPWLGPVFKTIELPGGWRFEFQELRRQQQEVRQQLEQVQGRIESVERIIFPRELGSDATQRLHAQVETFHQYLAGLGLSPEGRERPPLSVDPEALGAFYDPKTHRIEISPELLDNPHVLLREYCNYALGPDDASEVFDLATYDLKSALAFYLPCSFTGDADGFVEFGVDLRDTSPMVRRRGTPSPANQRRAFIWAGILWEARQLLGQPVIDRLVGGAWLAMARSAADQSAWLDEPRQAAYQATEERFVRNLFDLLPTELSAGQVNAFRDFLVRRRVLEKASAKPEP